MPTKTRPTLLSVATATRQARRIAERLMPALGPELNISSRLSHDLTADVPTVITVITFPDLYAKAYDLGVEIEALPGVRSIVPGSGRYTITRER